MGSATVHLAHDASASETPDRGGSREGSAAPDGDDPKVRDGGIQTWYA
jgi:hypothetical protein